MLRSIFSLGYFVWFHIGVHRLRWHRLIVSIQPRILASAAMGLGHAVTRIARLCPLPVAWTPPACRHWRSVGHVRETLYKGALGFFLPHVNKHMRLA